MNLSDYFLKSESISLFDMLIVSVLAVFIVYCLKSFSIFIWNLLETIYYKLKKLFTQTIPRYNNKRKRNKTYKKKIKSDDIDLLTLVSLVRKDYESNLLKFEKEALNKVSREEREKAEKIILNMEDVSKKIFN